MGNILVIKTGALGDVVRTTSLLNILEGNIYWVTSAESKALFADNIESFTALTINEAFQSLKNISFSQTISLEEDHDCARLAREIGGKNITGVYLDHDKIAYTDDSAYWFDMSRISKLGIKRANELKLNNHLSYQDCIFKMISKKFNGQPYCIFTGNNAKTNSRLIGIEKRTGRQWPDKQWWGYDELIHKLKKEGCPVKVFEQRENIRDYLNDIAECSHIVSGDTLAMHAALAYKKTCTAIFNCTSPQEIYDYGLLRKVVSQLLNKYFYSSAYDKEVIESVSVEEVYKTLPV